MKSCRIVKSGAGFHGKQGLDYRAGISAESVGSEAICMHLLTMSPGAEAKPHYHESHETAIYMLAGVAEFRHGPSLEFCDRVEAGDFVYIPAGRPASALQPRNRASRRADRPHRPQRTGKCGSCLRNSPLAARPGESLFLSGGVNHGALVRVGLHLAQDLVRHRGDVALARQEELPEEHERATLDPVEVDVRAAAGGLLDVQS